jgi:hypothetical protein
MPGFVYAVETIAGLFIVFPEWTRLQLAGSAKEGNLGIVIGAIFVSGALGYIFATVHHWWHWRFDRGILDHRSLVTRLRERGLIPDTLDQPDRRQALVLSMVLWYERVRENGAIQSVAEKKLTSLGDSIHGLGAARVASVFALATILGFCVTIGAFRPDVESVARFIAMLVLTLGMTLLFHGSYRNVGEIAQGVYEGILENALAEEHHQNNGA